MPKSHYHYAQKEVAKRSNIRELVFGMQDGLISTIGLVAGIFVATASNKFVIITGIIEVITGALSMSVGTYLSTKAERQFYDRVTYDQEKETRSDPEMAEKELLKTICDQGLKPKGAQAIIEALKKSKTAFNKTFCEKVLGLAPTAIHQSGKAAIVMGIAFVLGGIIPLLSFFFITGQIALYLAIAITAISLFIVGILKAKLARINIWRSGLEFVLLTLGIAGLGYIVGILIRNLV